MQKGQFKASYRRELIYDLRDIERNEKTLVDARPPGRFSGAEPEPRPNLVQGRIFPYALSFLFFFIPFRFHSSSLSFFFLDHSDCVPCCFTFCASV